MAETAEQVIERVLFEHQPRYRGLQPWEWETLCSGCEWSVRGDKALDHQAHVAAEVATALREAGLLVEREPVATLDIDHLNHGTCPRCQTYVRGESESGHDNDQDRGA